MLCLKHILRPSRIVLQSLEYKAAQPKKLVHKLTISRNIINESYIKSIPKTMAQRSITSFFTKTLNKSSESVGENGSENKASTSPDEKKSVKENGFANRRSSKRQRIESSGSENEIKSKSISPEPIEKKKTKRQRIVSSSSEASNTSPFKKTNQTTDNTTNNTIVKTESDIEVSTKPSIDLETNESNKRTPSNNKKTKKEVKTKSDSKKIKKELSSSSEESLKEDFKKRKASIEKKSKSPKEKAVKKEAEVKKKAEVKSPQNEKENKKSMNFFFKKEKVEDVEDVKGLVPEADYNPQKCKYDPVKDACWSAGRPVPYLALAKTLEAIEGTSARLKIVDTLANYFRSVMVLTPEDLLPSIYMCLNQLAPAYEGIELGIAETYLMKAVGACTGRTLAQMKSGAAKSGDLGLLAEQARSQQRTMFAPSPLTVRKVYEALKEIASMSGQASVNKKIAKIQSLYVACRYSEARYLIRSLEGKLRIGLAEQSVLQAIAVATAANADPPVDKISPEAFKSRVEEYASIIKSTYCECPNYNAVVPCLLERGVQRLRDHCKLTPGVPPRPMLAHPTSSITQLFTRFEGLEFTCEYKYDGERAQIHVPERDGKPDYANATIFSRNQENNTSKYPDILARLPKLLKENVTSCVIDCEAVAYDVEKKQILPFQVLSTRKRKDALEHEISVRVCVFVFDVLYLNAQALVTRELRARRDALRTHFNEVEGEWQFATSRDCSTMEAVQQFLDEAVRGSCEGLMVKTLAGKDATYEISKRSHNWLKLKKDYLDGVGDSIDVVVIGAYYGRGKRTGVFGGFLLACFDPSSEEYQSICKIGTGFSDDNLLQFTEELKQHAIDAPKSYYRYDASHSPDVWLLASTVWEIRCADLSLSPAHRAALGLVEPGKGVSLRFPRFIRVREDKSPEQATSAQQIADMYLAQDQVKNQKGNANKEVADEDYY